MLDITGYELIERIAQGGMASVWKARQLSLDRLVAIKVLTRESVPDPDWLDRFRKEAQISARLNHPNIVQVYDAGEVEGCAYLVMEYVEGKSVGDMLGLHGALPEDRALEIAAGVAEALAYAWEKECLIHCDINPNNLLIEEHTGKVKVTDLGIARLIGLRHHGHDDDLIIGTPNYTAPEQSAGVPDLDCRTDIYALGATLYHMVTGLLPFHDAAGSAAMTRHEEDFLEDPRVVNPELSAPAAWLIEKLMIKNRAFRPLFWTQVLEDIRLVRQGRMPMSPLPEEGTSTVRRAPDRPVAASVSTPRKMMVPDSARKSPIKLAIRKENVPAPAATALKTSDEQPVASAFRTFLGLLFLAAAVYTGFYFYGKVRGKPEPHVDGRSVMMADDEPEAVVVMEEPVADTSAAGWRNEDYLQGARLFNQALADYTAYQRDRSNPGVLPEIEAACRDAIAHFEAALPDAPEEINLNFYITQAYKLISDVHHSTQLSFDDAEDEAGSATQPAPSVAMPAQTARNNVVFVDDEPEPEPLVAEDKPEPQLNIALAPGWDNAAPGVIGNELSRLLTRHAVPTRDTAVDASVALYPGVMSMMTARDAARALSLELPMRRPLEAPGLPPGLHYYAWAGDFHGARELAIVCDRNDRVIMVRLFDDTPVPARMENALFTTNWTVYDFVALRSRREGDGPIAHRVRRRENLVRIDTEFAATASAGSERIAAARVTLMMPVQFAGMILQTNTTAEP